VRQGVSGQFANRDDQITHPVRRQANSGCPRSCEAADAGQISPVSQHLSIGREIAEGLAAPSPECVVPCSWGGGSSPRCCCSPGAGTALRRARDEVLAPMSGSPALLTQPPRVSSYDRRRGPEQRNRRPLTIPTVPGAAKAQLTCVGICLDRAAIPRRSSGRCTASARCQCPDAASLAFLYAYPS
jgi:hypothetical protein